MDHKTASEANPKQRGLLKKINKIKQDAITDKSSESIVDRAFLKLKIFLNYYNI